MSIKVIDYVWSNSKAKGSSLLLLLAIADHAHDDGTGAWPSIDTLAHKCRQSARNVIRLVQALEKLHELKVIPNGGPNGTNAYTIPLSSDKLSHTKSADVTTPARNVTCHSDKQVPQLSPKPSGTVIEPSSTTTEVVAVRENSREKKETPPPKNDECYGLAVRLYESSGKIINPLVAEKLKVEMEGVQPDWIRPAFEKWALAGAKNLNYLFAIWDDWKLNGMSDRKNGNGNGHGPPVEYRHEDWLDMQARPGETAEQTLARLIDAGDIPKGTLIRRRKAA